jgi:hypothetical protein
MDTQKFELSDNELSSEELDSASGGTIKGALEGVCKNDEEEAAKALNDFNALVSKLTQ